ncbi:MAG TPA: membrane protein insertase YidC, partial [Rhabdaerophilum sp.]|nr:membrane protein insertase YidC [Rhabdaerophilum sp.]
QTTQQAGKPGTSAPATPGAPPATAPGAPASNGAVPAAAPVTREAALATSPRIPVETPAVAGSIALTGGRIDDLSLVNYHETVDKKSPRIVLFAPQGVKDAYFADFGWVAAAGQTAVLPTAETKWTADAQTLKPGSPVTLNWDNGQGLVFKRKFEVDDKFLFTIIDSVENKGTAPVALSNYGRVTRVGTPHTSGYGILHEGPLGYLADSLSEPSYDDVKKGKVKSVARSEGGWLGFTDKYWASAIVPGQNKPFSAAFGATGADPVFEAAAIGEVQTLAPGATVTAENRLFAGAKEVNVINAYSDKLGLKRFDLMIDWGWFHFITKPLFHLLEWVFKLVGNFGVAILIVTVLVKLVFYPLANKSYASMAKMKAVQPEMLRIRDQFADDKMKQQQAMMELYKKEKINPMAGCLPVLLQIPVFFALYKVLLVTIEMRHAPFFGWIKDLSAQDPTNMFNLFGLIPFTPPSFLHLGIWPLIMGVTMFVQMKMNPEPTDPVQKTMFAWMPVIFTFMLGSFPAGLVIYWAWNNTLSVLQQYTIMKRMGTKIELWDNLMGTFRPKKG